MSGKSKNPIIKPALGRFNMAQSLMPADFVKGLMSQMRKVQWLFWPLLTLPTAAHAMAPPGFEQFEPVYQENFVQ